MIIGIHSRDNDLVVNPIKGKQLTNVRASGTDEAVRLMPPIQVTLESAIEFIADDELVEITPKSIRIRKRFLQDTSASARRAPPLSRSADRSRARCDRLALHPLEDPVKPSSGVGLPRSTSPTSP